MKKTTTAVSLGMIIFAFADNSLVITFYARGFCGLLI